jgi:hypothetical protein
LDRAGRPGCIMQSPRCASWSADVPPWRLDAPVSRWPGWPHPATARAHLHYRQADRATPNPSPRSRGRRSRALPKNRQELRHPSMLIRLPGLNSADGKAHPPRRHRASLGSRGKVQRGCRASQLRRTVAWTRNTGGSWPPSK